MNGTAAMAYHSRDFHARTGAALDRADRGRMSYHAGLAAEACVADAYTARGHRLIAERWRGRRGEIDLVFADGDAVILVEVKKSRDFDTALSHVTPAQVARLYATAEEFIGTMPQGNLTDIRLDVALVDARGEISILENAFAA